MPKKLSKSEKSYVKRTYKKAGTQINRLEKAIKKEQSIIKKQRSDIKSLNQYRKKARKYI